MVDAERLIDLVTVLIFFFAIGIAARLWLSFSRYLSGERLTLRLEVQQIAPALAPPEEDSRLPSSGDIPDRVVEFCAKESEPWAREALLQRARVLYAEIGLEGEEGWDAVLLQLDQSETRV